MRGRYLYIFVSLSKGVSQIEQRILQNSKELRQNIVEGVLVFITCSSLSIDNEKDGGGREEGNRKS